MPIVGFVLHHSACPSINGKGFDYYITRSGGIVPGTEQTSPDHIHICVEGNFGPDAQPLDKEQKEQLFVAQKLLISLAAAYSFDPTALHTHNHTCPGPRFPWSELVISTQDGYH